MRKGGFVLVVLVFSMTALVTVVPDPTQVRAWGLTTHQFIVSEAMDALSNQTWREAFDFYAPELLAGSITPDTAWQDWHNHLYYPETGEYDAPYAAGKWYNNTRGNMTVGNWEEAFFSMGVMSHYFVDPHIPVHTDENWIGHSAYERDINAHLEDLVIGILAETPAGNVSQMVVDGAMYSHQFYDMVYEAYPETNSEALMTNSTIKTFTENCLTKAINGTLSLFYNFTQYVEPPDVSVFYQYVALFDYAHSNDYTDYFGEDKLTSVNQTLARKGFEMRKQTTELTESDLIGVDLFVATCALDAYITSELTAIANWASTGNKSIILAARGDYDYYTDIAQPNRILESVGSDIRFTDDNVYMEGTHNPWYNDIYTIPSPEDTLNLTYDVSAITFFSPTSLYFLDDYPVLPVIYADVTGYQTDQSPPVPNTIWDNVMDGVFGYQIPLTAVEEIGTFRLLAAGTTFFSDFDYGETEIFDNNVFLENFLDWAVGDRNTFNVPAVDEIGPRISNVSWTPSIPDLGNYVNVTAIVTDPSGIFNVTLSYNNGTHWIHYPMEDKGSVLYSAYFSQSDITTVSFRITAFDIAENREIRTPFDITYSLPTTTTTTITYSLPTTTTTTITDGDIATWLVIGTGVSAVLVVLVIIILLRKR